MNSGTTAAVAVIMLFGAILIIFLVLTFGIPSDGDSRDAQEQSGESEKRVSPEASNSGSRQSEPDDENENGKAGITERVDRPSLLGAIEVARTAAASKSASDLVQESDHVLMRLYEKSAGLGSTSVPIARLKFSDCDIPELCYCLMRLRDAGHVVLGNPSQLEAQWLAVSPYRWLQPAYVTRIDDSDHEAQAKFYHVKLTQSGLRYASEVYRRRSSVNIEKVHMSGDTIWVGDNSNVVNRSLVKNSLNRVREDYGDSVASGLGEIAAQVEKSGDTDAKELLNSFNEELQKESPKKPVLRTLFTGISNAVPAITQMAEAMSKIAPLFQ